MYQIVDTPNTKTKPLPENDIFSRSKENNDGINNYTPPGFGMWLKAFLSSPKYKKYKKYQKLFYDNNGIKDVSVPKGDTDDTSEDLGNTILLPPNEVYSTIIPPEGEEIASNVDGLATKQLINQFYETYMVPTGFKDVYNRLGSIAGNISDIHSLYPKGIRGLLGADSNASWRTGLNFSFVVNSGLKNQWGSSIIDKYSSLAFPPFISHDVLDINSLSQAASSNSDTEESNALDTTFDMKNVLYRKNQATFRFAAFKQVNDNIHLLQTLLNRCFGIESTYINEWDLSLYMQENLLSYKEYTDTNGDTTRVPQFVTTLTYGLLDDAPIEILKNSNGNVDSSNVNLDKVTPFASVNCAVSTRYGIDNEAVGSQANDLNYIISDYPLSSYWYPNEDGNNSSTSNVANYIDNMFAYTEVGEPFNEANPTGHWYTPAIYYGGDLTKSTKRFKNILNYTDDRYAVLSGWNSTDDQGELYLSQYDNSNNSANSNAYSYLPFWKQFYTNDEDGLSDVDKYIQEIMAKDSEISFLNAAYQIIGIITSSNETFNEMCSEKSPAAQAEQQTAEEGGDAVDQSAYQTDIAAKYGAEDSEPSDYSFGLFRCRITIKGSRLLKMFLNRNKQTKKAKSAANDAQNSTGMGDVEVSDDGTVRNSGFSSNALKNAKTTKTLDEPVTTIVDGQEVEVDTYVPESDDELASKKVVGDGIAEWSPFLYGGPHGKYLSPLTLEGYTQFDNQNLANVPTVDPYRVFNGDLLSGASNKGLSNVRLAEFSKNIKTNGSYIDVVTCLTPNERAMLLTGNGFFGRRGLRLNDKAWVPYTSSVVTGNRVWYNRDVIDEYYVKHSRGYPRIDGSYDKWQRFQDGRWLNSNWWYWRYWWHRHPWQNHYDCYYYENFKYGNRNSNFNIGVSRYEDIPVQTTDWTSMPFRLIPTCGWDNGFWRDNSNNNWTKDTARWHIIHDQQAYRKMTSYNIDENGKKFYNYQADRGIDKSACVKYLVAPICDGAQTVCGNLYGRWTHCTSYSTVGTTWYNELKKNYEAGRRELKITLPIQYYGTITNLICGVANIYKSRGLVYYWKLHCRTYWRARHRRRWWRCHWRRYHIHWWTLEVKEADMYQMYFRPDKMFYNIPTEYLIRQEAKYTNQRNKGSSNIIERWCVDGSNSTSKVGFKSIGDGSGSSPKLFPFTTDFIDKYGYREPYLPLPNYTTRNHANYCGDLKILRTKGLYYHDVLDSYRDCGYVKTVTGLSCSYKRFTSDYYFNFNNADEWYSQDRHRYWGTEALYFNTQKSTLTFTSNAPIYSPSRYSYNSTLTKLLNNCMSWPTVQEYQTPTNPKQNILNWYRVTDPIDVYIDTATQQIKWLEQLRDYANLYLSDSLIYDVYKKSTDYKIQKIIKYHEAGDLKEGQNYKDGCGGWTTSFTEDVNYHDALAIVEKVFNTSDSSKNTIYNLTVRRISHLQALLNYAKTIRNSYNSSPLEYMNRFVRLVTNTRSFLDGAQTDGERVEDIIFSAAGYYRDTLFSVNDSTTFDLTTNPGAVLWAYLNVLYQVRKYWVNVRFNKSSGSYWYLRGLERVLVFLAAKSTAEDSTSTDNKHVSQGTSDELKTKKITFVQSRDSAIEQFNSTDLMNNSMTHAIYVKVNYIGTPVPEKSTKWNEAEQTYDGNEIVYVNEAYRWAKKPQDGLYYVMSTTINNTITNNINTVKGIVSGITAKTYIVTDDDFENVFNSLKGSSNDYSSDIGDEKINTVEKLQTVIETIKNNSSSTKLSELYSTVADGINVSGIGSLGNTVAENCLIVFTNLLMEYKNSYYEALRNQYFYKIYIKWDPKHVYTALDESGSNSGWYIDELQKVETLGKERKVTDLYNYEHTSTEAISAGITFDVTAALNPETLISSATNLKTSSIMEIVCSSNETIDLWRIQIPSKLNIPVELLKDNPILVPAYIIDSSVNGLKTNQVIKSTKSVLAGVATNAILPVLEATEDMCTVNTLDALGEFDAIADVGN